MVVVIDDKSEFTSNLSANPPTTESSSSGDFSSPDPPPYETVGSSTSPTPNRKATNHLEISQYLAPISGEWKIDTRLRIPKYGRGAVSPDDQPNLSLKTQIGTISASIELVGGPERARLVNITSLGTISVRIINPTAQKIDLVCQTSTGTVTVYLPRSFTGPLTLKSDLGTRSFSNAIENNTTIFSTRSGVTHGFIGDYERSGYGQDDGKGWKGDQLFVQSSLGTVTLYYIDEWKKRMEDK